MSKTKLEVAQEMLGKTVSFEDKEGEFTGKIIEVKDAYTFIADIGDGIKYEVDLYQIRQVR